MSRTPTLAERLIRTPILSAPFTIFNHCPPMSCSIFAHSPFRARVRDCGNKLIISLSSSSRVSKNITCNSFVFYFHVPQVRHLPLLSPLTCLACFLSFLMNLLHFVEHPSYTILIILDFNLFLSRTNLLLLLFGKFPLDVDWNSKKEKNTYERL